MGALQPGSKSSEIVTWRQRRGDFFKSYMIEWSDDASR